MRSLRLFTVLSIAVILTASLLLVGCGSDDESSLIIGSYEDPDFLAVQDQMNIFVDSTVEFIATGLNSISSIAAYDDQINPTYYGPIFPETDNVTATYTNGWHIVNIIRSRTEWQFHMSDSVRFYNEGQHQQSAQGVDSMYYRHHWRYQMADTVLSNAALNGDANWSFTGLNTNNTNVNGWSNQYAKVKVVGEQNRAVREFSIESDVSNLSVAQTGSGWEQGCPNSGTITATVQVVTTINDQTPVTNTWHAVFTFDHGTVSANLVRGDVNWFYQENICDAVTN